MNPNDSDQDDDQSSGGSEAEARAVAAAELAAGQAALGGRAGELEARLARNRRHTGGSIEETFVPQTCCNHKGFLPFHKDH